MGKCLHKTLAEQCGAVLMREKPAALFPLKDTEHTFEAAAALLAANGLQVRRLRCEQNRTLLLVYEPGMLKQTLDQQLPKKALGRIGYPVESGLWAMLEKLEQRVRDTGGFPHEIGFFLGYPPADVMGFILYSGRRPKHCCMWKVYSDVDRAKTLCGKYMACRHFCSSHIEQGGDLHSLYKVINQAGYPA